LTSLYLCACLSVCIALVSPLVHHKVCSYVCVGMSMHVQKEAQPLRTSTLMLSVLLTKLDVLRVKPCSLVYRYSCTKEFCLYRCLCMCLCMCMGSVAHGLHLKRVRMCACVRVSRICWHYSNGKDNTTRINLIIRQASSTASTACLLLIRARFPTCPRCCLLTWPPLSCPVLLPPLLRLLLFLPRTILTRH